MLFDPEAAPADLPPRDVFSPGVEEEEEVEEERWRSDTLDPSEGWEDNRRYPPRLAPPWARGKGKKGKKGKGAGRGKGKGAKWGGTPATHNGKNAERRLRAKAKKRATANLRR